MRTGARPASASRAGRAAFCLAVLGACTERVPLPAGVDAADLPDVAMIAEVPDGSAVEPTDGAARDTARRDTAPPRDGGPSLCIEHTEDVEFRPDMPSVIIALERSHSMYAGRIGETSRFAAVTAALRNAVRLYQGAVAFGYEEFPAMRSSCSGCCAGEVRVVPAPNGLSAFERVTRCEAGPSGCVVTSTEAPAHQALAECGDFYEAFGKPGGRFVLLVTDGEPSCASVRDSCQRTAATAARLLMNGVRTAVLAVSDEARASGCLDAVAFAGGLQRPGAPHYYLATDDIQLRSQLQEILSPIAARSCRISLLGSGLAPERLAVFIGKTEVRSDPRDGWTLEIGPPGRILTLHGAACEKLKGVPVSEALKVYSTCTRCLGSSACR